MCCANLNTSRDHTNPTYTRPKYLVQIRAKSISAGVVHGDALSDIVVVTVCVYVLWTWVDPARGVSAGVELGWGLLDGPKVSLKSGFQLNPWLSSKRTRKMTEVHDMARSPHPAKPFHFGPFVSLQLLIFMITPPDITPHIRPTTSPQHHPNWKKKNWTGLKNKADRVESQSQTLRFLCSTQHREYLRNIHTERGSKMRSKRKLKRKK